MLLMLSTGRRTDAAPESAGCKIEVFTGIPRLWSPAVRPETTTGGGGGTAHPRLSPRAGLCLHPFAQQEDAERVIRLIPSVGS